MAKSSRRGGRRPGQWIDVTPDEIRAFREVHGISRHRLARALGVSSTTIQNWETNNGVAMPKLQKMVAEVIRLGPDAINTMKGVSPYGSTCSPAAVVGPQMTAAATIVSGYLQVQGSKMSTEQLLELIKSVRGALT